MENSERAAAYQVKLAHGFLSLKQMAATQGACMEQLCRNGEVIQQAGKSIGQLILQVNFQRF